jgi:hypothetical protein
MARSSLAWSLEQQGAFPHDRELNQSVGEARRAQFLT